MPKYILSPQAQESLRDIRDFSLENFGKEQTNIYLQSIRKRMRDLAKQPSRGRIREDLKAGYYSDFVGSHTIYYRIQETHIEIIDVPHQSMEPTRHIGV